MPDASSESFAPVLRAPVAKGLCDAPERAQRTNWANRRQPQNIPLARWETWWVFAHLAEMLAFPHEKAASCTASWVGCREVGSIPPEARYRGALVCRRRIQRPQDAVGDRGSAIAAAELARLEAGGEGAVDGGLDGTRGLGGTLVAVAIGEPVQHHRGGEDHRGRIGEPLAHDIGRGAVTRLKYRVLVADVGRGRHAHTADQTGGEVGEDVAEHVLHDQHIEIPWS